MGKGGSFSFLSFTSILARTDRSWWDFFGNNAPSLAHMGFIVKCVGIHYDMNTSGLLGRGMAPDLDSSMVFWKDLFTGLEWGFKISSTAPWVFLLRDLLILVRASNEGVFRFFPAKYSPRFSLVLCLFPSGYGIECSHCRLISTHPIMYFIIDCGPSRDNHGVWRHTSLWLHWSKIKPSWSDFKKVLCQQEEFAQANNWALYHLSNNLREFENIMASLA